MSKVNTDVQFGMDSDPLTKEMMLQALQLAESIVESEDGAETLAALDILHIEKKHLSSLKARVRANKGNQRFKLTLGDHILLYTCFYLFTKFYPDELTSQMLSSMDDMDRMHLDEPEILQLRIYSEEMLKMMNASKERFASFQAFAKHVNTLESTFSFISG